MFLMKYKCFTLNANISSFKTEGCLDVFVLTVLDTRPLHFDVVFITFVHFVFTENDAKHCFFCYMFLFL